MTKRTSLEIAGTELVPGERHELELRPAQLPSGGWMPIPVVAFHGRQNGPVVWLSAALHGDEVNGVEIIRQVMSALDPEKMRGTVLAVPVVNVPGFATGDRYMPDRRDLNRSFPGSASGSLASRFAHAFMTEIVRKSDVGIDLHTGSDHRHNIPQIRADLTDELTRELTTAFGAPFALHARLRDGSLREAAVRSDARVLLYEAGESWRFDQQAIEVGVLGVRRVLAHLKVATAGRRGKRTKTIELAASRWVRSPMSGLARLSAELGEHVEAGDRVGVVGDAIGSTEKKVIARHAGWVIGRTESPVVHRGDALIHIAEQRDPEGSS
ncbi:MAG: deacylase [Acidimicrobiales bacterium]|nr:MAG: deacylase [Acidimicrobiales bacterium]